MIRILPKFSIPQIFLCRVDWRGRPVAILPNLEQPLIPHSTSVTMEEVGMLEDMCDAEGEDPSVVNRQDGDGTRDGSEKHDYAKRCGTASC